VRTLEHYTHNQGEILAAMNHRALARSGAAREPQRRGPRDRRSAVGALLRRRRTRDRRWRSGPFDAVHHPEATFTPTAVNNSPPITHGMVKARGKERELFSFARTQAIGRQSSERIAQTAQTFGRDGEITVRSLTRSAR